MARSDRKSWLRKQRYLSKQSNSVDFRKAAVNYTKGPRLAFPQQTWLFTFFAGVSVLHFFFLQIPVFISEEKGEDTLHTLS